MRINREFLLLVLFLFVINIPYFASPYYFVPAHDSMDIASIFFISYNEYVVNNEVPLWLPYYLYGSPVNPFLKGFSPALCFVAFVGKLFSIGDALLLFKIGILIEQLALFVGAYLLACRLFCHRTTILFVCIGAIATAGFWGINLVNLRTYYLVPLVLFFIIKFYDTGHFKYVFLAGIIAFLSLGTSGYVSVVVFFLYFLFSITLFFTTFKRVFSHKKTLFTPSSFLLFLLLLTIVIGYVVWILHAGNHAILYAPGRDHITGKVSLKSFLTYGPVIALNNLLEVIYATPADRDLTFYIGLIPLIFLVYALTKRYDRVLKAILASIIGILLLSLSYLTFVAPVMYLFFPLFDYFRHLGLIRPPIKILALLVSGFGIDAFLNTHRRDTSKRLSIVWIGVGMVSVILFLDIFAFKGTFPYASYLTTPPHGSSLTPFFTADFFTKEKPELFYFHFFALSVLVIFLWLVYRAVKLKIRNIRKILIGCFMLEILSYQYFLFYISPVTFPEIPSQQSETVEDYKRDIAHLKSSFKVFNYGFQDKRTVNDQTFRVIYQTNPLLLFSFGVKYLTLYSAAYVDPCFQRYRVDYSPLSVDRFVRARLGIPLDKPLIGKPPLLENLQDDEVFLRAMGCNAPKLFLTSHVRVAKSLADAAGMIRNSQDLDKTPIIFSEIFQVPEPPQSPSSQSESAGTIQVTRFTANSLSVQADVASLEGAWLIYLDGYHPDWIATVNGQKREIVTANLAFKAVRLDSGGNDVQFTFTGNERNRYSIQIFFYLGIVSVLLFIGTTVYLSIRDR